MKPSDNWKGILKAQHFYAVLILLLNALQIKSPDLISTIPSFILIAAMILSTISAIYLLTKIKAVKECRKLSDTMLIILLTIAGNIMLIVNM